MKKMVKSLVLVSLLLAFAAVSVAAQEKKTPKKKGEKSTAAKKAEGQKKWIDSILKNHPKADKNKDGKLSKEEMEAFRKVAIAEMGKKLLASHPEIDTNKDGKLSREEMTAFRKANAKKPQNKDAKAKVTDKKVHAKKEKSEHSRDARKPGVFRGHSADRIKMILERYPKADKNKDGKLDEKEMEALKKKYVNKPIDAKRAKKMLAENPKMDANKDGKLTMGEVQKWYQAKNAQKKDGEKAKPEAKKVEGKKDKPAEKKAEAKKARPADKKANAKKKGPGKKQLANMLRKNPKADANKDGKLTVKEMQAFRKANAVKKAEAKKKK